jgi:hypothetical protein
MANSKVGGSSALSQIEDKHSAAAFADVLFRGGGPVGAEMIQNAANETLKTIPDKERRDLGVPDHVEVDGVIGPETFNTFKKLSSAGHGQVLRRQLSDLRQIEWRDERSRNDHFRFAR